MLTRHAARRPGRGAFTLIELLVVIGILAFLAGLSVLIITNVDAYQRAPAGASQVQQMLMIAKQRAVRDRRPHGIRLVLDPANTSTRVYARTVVFIEQPEDYAVQPGVTRAPDLPTVPITSRKFLPFRRISGTGTTITLEPLDPNQSPPNPAPDFSGGQGTDMTLWPVQVGDYLEINGTGLPHRIAALTATTLTLTTALPADVQLTGHYRIIRQPRPAGDDPVSLPQDVVLDLSPGTNKINPPSLDIVFAPSGEVIGTNTGTDSIYLWVRDETLLLHQGDNTLVVVYSRSGAIAAHPVDRPPNDPYSFAKEGRSSGL